MLGDDSSLLAREYVRARRVLLDALEALENHRNAAILIGAQAIYLHTGEADFAVSAFTTDADLALDPFTLEPAPKLEQMLTEAGFSTDPSRIGIWTSIRGGANVDFLVPESVGGRGKRSADLGEHGNRIARKARGLEAVLVDRRPMLIQALNSEDERRFTIAVAGPAALLTAKMHKIAERRDDPRRLKPKDALDSLRLLQAVETEDLATVFITLCQNPISQEITKQALIFLDDLFSTEDSLGTQLTVKAVEALEDPTVIAASCATLSQDLLAAIPQSIR